MQVDSTLTTATGGGASLSSANTFTALQTFSGNALVSTQFGVNSLPSGDTSAIGSDVNESAYFTRTTNNGSGTVSLLQHNYYATTPVDNTQVVSAGLFDAVNNAGSGVSGGAGHFPALIGRSTDTLTGAMNMVGVEGKVHRLGTSDVGSAVWGIMDYDMTSAAGRTAIAFNAWAEFYSGGNTSNTINAGNFIAYNVTTPACANASSSQTGWYSIFAGDWFQVKTGGAISSYSQGANNAKNISMLHNGTDGVMSTNSGNLQLAGGGGFVITQTGQSLVPLTTGGALGITSNRWALAASTINQSGLTTVYNGVTTAGWGHPAIVAFGSVSGASAAGTITGATYTVGASDGLFEVSGNLNVTAAVAVSTSINCVYTDETNTSRTMIIPISGLAGSFLAGGLATSTGPFEGTVMTIRCKAATTITISIAAGTFTSVTYDAYGTIKQVA